MAGDAPSCPGCQHELGRPGVWQTDGASCPHCRRELEFSAFPALTTGRTATHPLVAAVADDATCFFHTENRAVAVCEGCGRYLCTVCGIDYAGSRLCPSCVAGRTRAGRGDVAARDFVLHDSIAMALAILPLLSFFFTLVTGPVALGYVIYAWQKPLGLLRRSRWRLWVAGGFALVEIAGWSAFFVARAMG